MGSTAYGGLVGDPPCQPSLRLCAAAGRAIRMHAALQAGQATLGTLAAPGLAGGALLVHEGAVEAGVALVGGAAPACRSRASRHMQGWRQGTADSAVARHTTPLCLQLPACSVDQQSGCLSRTHPNTHSLSDWQHGLPSWPQSAGFSTHVPLLYSPTQWLPLGPPCARTGCNGRGRALRLACCIVHAGSPARS